MVGNASLDYGSMSYDIEYLFQKIVELFVGPVPIGLASQKYHLQWREYELDFPWKRNMEAHGSRFFSPSPLMSMKIYHGSNDKNHE